MDNVLWKTIGTIIAVIAIIVPAYVAYDINQKSHITKHQLEIKKLFKSNPASFLSDLDGKFELTADGEKIVNLNIIYFNIKNTGQKPILPKEYFENISISVDKKWKIVGVSNENSSPKGVGLIWQKAENGEFFAQPALINPEDSFTVAVYVVGGSESKDKEEKISVKWSARIENLSEISVREPERIKFRLSGIIVLLTGWALPFTIVSFVLMFGTILFLANKANILPSISGLKIALIVFLSTLAISASEVLAYYIYEPISVGGVTWLNWSILFMQSVVLIWLSVKVIMRKNA